MAFFPGVLLEYQWSFIDDFSWFCITLISFCSFCDTVGRLIASYFDIITKGGYLWSTIIRGIFFTTVYLLNFNSVAVEFFGATWWMIVCLFFFATSFGYLVTIGFKYGGDETVGDQAIAGTLNGFHMTLGISIGSTLALTCLKTWATEPSYHHIITLFWLINCLN